MAIVDGIKRQLRSVIEWDNPAPDDLFCRWSDNGDEDLLTSIVNVISRLF